MKPCFDNDKEESCENYRVKFGMSYCLIGDDLSAEDILKGCENYKEYEED